MAQQSTEASAAASGLSKMMGKKLQILLPALLSQNGVEDGVVDMIPNENWVIREEALQIFKEAVSGHCSSKEFSYPTGLGGDSELLEAFAPILNQYFQPTVPIEPEHLVTASGVGNLVDAVAQTICDDGDSILIAGPCWGGYQALLRFHGNINIVTANTPSFYRACTSDILAALETTYSNVQDPARIRALLVCNPHNPVGRCYSAETIRSMMRFCSERGMHYISDEIFGLSMLSEDVEIGRDAGPPFVSALSIGSEGSSSEQSELPIQRSHVHVLWGLSKAFAASGIRLGVLVSQSNKLLLAGVVMSTFWQVSLPSSLYARCLLTSGRVPMLLETSVARLSSNYRTLTARLRDLGIKYIPCRSGFGLYARLAPNAETWDEEAAMVRKIREHGAAVQAGKTTSGGVDGGKGWARISFAITEEMLREGLARIETALKAH